MRIVLADRHMIFREGLICLLETQPDIQVTGHTGDGAELLRMVAETSPDIIITDVFLRSVDGFEATRGIVARSGARVIALSTYADRRSVIGMLTAGAFGFVHKDCSYNELVQAIRAVAAGKTYLSPSVSDILVNEHFHNMANGSRSPEDLISPRELQVLRLLAEGNSTKKTAEELDISVKTVETHRQHLMQKLDVDSLAELVKYAVRARVTSLE